jgi:hypothetical protein
MAAFMASLPLSLLHLQAPDTSLRCTVAPPSCQQCGFFSPFIAGLVRLWLLKRRRFVCLSVCQAEDLPGVSLALSLHAPTQELRQAIVPSAKAYKLDKLMAAVAAYQEQTGQRVGGCGCRHP